jgi:hypothetical protein
MRHLTKRLDFGKNDTISIGATSCWHVGNPQCRVSRIQEMVAEFVDRQMPWVMLGDIIEGIAPLDRRYHQDTHHDSINLQVHDAKQLMVPAKGLLLGISVGNHEDTAAKMVGDITADLLRRLYGGFRRNRWFGGATRMQFRCPDGEVSGFFAHSRITLGGGTSDPERDEVTRKIKLRRRLMRFDANFKVVGHGHHMLVAPPVYMDKLTTVNKRGQMVPTPYKPEWVAMSPSMFASYDDDDYPSYAEQALLPPGDIGWIECVLRRDGTVVELKERKVL